VLLRIGSVVRVGTITSSSNNNKNSSSIVAAADFSAIVPSSHNEGATHPSAGNIIFHLVFEKE
jgi:hypothetical protein